MAFVDLLRDKITLKFEDRIARDENGLPTIEQDGDNYNLFAYVKTSSSEGFDNGIAYTTISTTFDISYDEKLWNFILERKDIKIVYNDVTYDKKNTEIVYRADGVPERIRIMGAS